jgi:ABC-2 type transport system ATP-binding protein
VTEPLVRVAGVKKTFRPPASVRLLLGGKLRGAPVVALDGIDVDVARGEAVGLMGANGAGKSTLLRILAGLIVPTAGTVNVCGLDASRGGSALARKVGYVAADERGLSHYLSAREQLAWLASLHGYRRAEALRVVGALVEQMGMTPYADRPLRELSTGMRRRASLARGLLGAPEVLLLDEPTRGVDPAGSMALHEHLRAALRRGCAIVIATHDRDEARSVCARVAVLDEARLLALEPPELAVQRLVDRGDA